MTSPGAAPHVRLRDVTPDDVGVYVAMRCDPVMMAELGGPLPREGIEAKVHADVAAVLADESWIRMIEVAVPEGDGDPDGTGAAGIVVLWSHEEGGATISEIGWMVLPRFQGRGVAKAAVRLLLDAARADGRWGVISAFPGVTNGPSNGICRSLGFTPGEEVEIDFADRPLAARRWWIDPAGSGRDDLSPG